MDTGPHMGIPTAMTIGMHMAEMTDASALYRFLTFFSPAFPIGAFSYSHGLEQVIEDGGVHNPESLRDWLTDILNQGSGRSDAILLAQAYDAVRCGNEPRIRELIDLGLALQPSKERHLETGAQGTAFMVTFAAAWMPDLDRPAAQLLARLTDRHQPDCPKAWPYPVAVGAAAAGWELSKNETALAYTHAFISNLIFVAIRAVPLGQTDGQRVLAALEPVCQATVVEALDAGLDDLGTSVFLADIASMAHETQYTRLFRT